MEQFRFPPRSTLFGPWRKTTPRIVCRSQCGRKSIEYCCQTTTREDLVGSESHKQQTYLRFAYGAAQGNFELLIPENRCRIIDTESTVENIAQYIADEISTENPGVEISVRAFEGIGKGAIGTSG